MIFNALLLFLLGKILGSTPSLGVIQTVLLIAGAGLIGRKFCLDALPLDPAMQRESPDLRKSLAICLHNQPLVGFSIYLCFIYLGFSAAVPLALVYMKTALNLTAEAIMIITSLHLVGKVTGFLLFAYLARRVAMRFFLPSVHLLTILCVGSLLLLLPGTPHLPIWFGIESFLLGVLNALLLNINSVEILALAKPGNKIMAIAFCSTAIAIGTASGTVVTSFLLGCGALAGEWTLLGFRLTQYQLLFGIYTIGLCFILILLPLVPAVIRKHDNYYNP